MAAVPKQEVPVDTEMAAVPKPEVLVDKEMAAIPKPENAAENVPEVEVIKIKPRSKKKKNKLGVAAPRQPLTG